MGKGAHLLFGLAVGIAAAPSQTSVVNVQSLTARPLVHASVAPQGRNSISGYVFTETRRPVERVRIELLDEVDTVLASTFTGGAGFYNFTGLSSGTFQIRVLTHGTDYISQTERLTIANITRSSSDSVQLNFTLRTKVAASASAAPGTTFVQEVPAAARKVYEKAKRDLADANKVEAGIENLKKAIDIFPTYYIALESLGAEYVKRGQYEPASIVLAKALEVNPRGHMSAYALGFAQYHLKQIPAAIDSLRRSIATNPKSVNSHLLLGMALRSDGKLDQAETYLKQAKELGKHPDAYWQLGLIYNQQKRYKEAADELELFLKAQPDSRDSEKIKKLIAQLRTQAK